MTNLPPEFTMPTVGKIGNGTAQLFLSQHEGVPFSFKHVKVPNAQKSAELGYEYEDDVEMVDFYTDQKTVSSHPITKKLFSSHPEILPEYERWKAGQAANITDLREWKAASPSEVQSCFRAGFICVEQIVDASEERLHALGLEWRTILNKAKQHKAAKELAADKDNAVNQVLELKETMQKRDEEHAAQMAAIMKELGAVKASTSPLIAADVIADVDSKAAPAKGRYLGKQKAEIKE